jgi:hypothetical protein
MAIKTGKKGYKRVNLRKVLDKYKNKKFKRIRTGNIKFLKDEIEKIIKSKSNSKVQKQIDSNVNLALKSKSATSSKQSSSFNAKSIDEKDVSNNRKTSTNPDKESNITKIVRSEKGYRVIRNKKKNLINCQSDWLSDKIETLDIPCQFNNKTLKEIIDEELLDLENEKIPTPEEMETDAQLDFSDENEVYIKHYKY